MKAYRLVILGRTGFAGGWARPNALCNMVDTVQECAATGHGTNRLLVSGAGWVRHRLPFVVGFVMLHFMVHMTLTTFH